MRLESNDQAPLSAHFAGGLERRNELGRVMRVVVVDPDAPSRTLWLEPPSRASERRQTLLEVCRCETEPEPRRQGRGRVQSVVLPRDVQLHRSQATASVDGFPVRT